MILPSGSFASFLLETAESALLVAAIHHNTLKQTTVWQDRIHFSQEIDLIGSFDKWGDGRFIPVDGRLDSPVSPFAISANRSVIDETSDSMSPTKNEKKNECMNIICQQNRSEQGSVIMRLLSTNPCSLLLISSSSFTPIPSKNPFRPLQRIEFPRYSNVRMRW